MAQSVAKILQILRRWHGLWLEHFGDNTGAWMLFGLLLLAECGNYKTGNDLNRVCELLGENFTTENHFPRDEEEISNICSNHDPNNVEDDPP